MTMINEKLMEIIKKPARKGENKIASLLRCYYEDVCEHIFPEDDDNISHVIAPEYYQPVEERTCGIAEAIRILMEEQGYRMDVAPDGEYPLKWAVGCADSVMVKYLIKHGADCRKWLADGEKEDPDERNWYLEDIDVTLCNASSDSILEKSWFDSLFQTALALVTDGGLTEDFGSVCLSVHDHTLSMSRMQAKF